MRIKMIWPADKWVSAQKVCALANDAMIDEKERTGEPLPELFTVQTCDAAARYLDDHGLATFAGEWDIYE